jgi:hypothetical protein
VALATVVAVRVGANVPHPTRVARSSRPSAGADEVDSHEIGSNTVVQLRERSSPAERLGTC